MLLIRFRTHVIAYRNQNSSKRVYPDCARPALQTPVQMADGAAAGDALAATAYIGRALHPDQSY
jgi:hypothetical protein